MRGAARRLVPDIVSNLLANFVAWVLVLIGVGAIASVVIAFVRGHTTLPNNLLVLLVIAGFAGVALPIRHAFGEARRRRAAYPPELADQARVLREAFADVAALVVVGLSVERVTSENNERYRELRRRALDAFDPLEEPFRRWLRAYPGRQGPDR